MRFAIRALTRAVVMLIGVPYFLGAQADSSKWVIAGTVVDPLRSPVDGVEIRVLGSTASTLTAANGQFRLLVQSGRDVLLQFRRPGYEAQMIRMAGGWRGEIVLRPGVYRLPDIAVNARFAKPSTYAATNKYDDFFRRRRQGFGIFIDREQIERRAPVQVSDLLQAQPGIKAEVTTAGVGWMFYFARCNERRIGNDAAITPMINVYIDGRKQQREYLNPYNGELLDRVHVGDIEMIEIFRGPGELPPEFNDGNCGAIVIWTRQRGG